MLLMSPISMLLWSVDVSELMDMILSTDDVDDDGVTEAILKLEEL